MIIVCSNCAWFKKKMSTREALNAYKDFDDQEIKKKGIAIGFCHKLEIVLWKQQKWRKDKDCTNWKDRIEHKIEQKDW